MDTTTAIHKKATRDQLDRIDRLVADLQRNAEFMGNADMAARARYLDFKDVPSDRQLTCFAANVQACADEMSTAASEIANSVRWLPAAAIQLPLTGDLR